MAAIMRDVWWPLMRSWIGNTNFLTSTLYVFSIKLNLVSFLRVGSCRSNCIGANRRRGRPADTIAIEQRGENAGPGKLLRPIARRARQAGCELGIINAFDHAIREGPSVVQAGQQSILAIADHLRK